jgi:hypothetical protein
LAVLRGTPFPFGYTPDRPALLSIAFVAVISTMLIIVIFGKLIRDGYDGEPKPRSSPPVAPSAHPAGTTPNPNDWMMTEYGKRKTEKDKPEDTIARVNKDKLEWTVKYSTRSEDDRSKAVKKRVKELEDLEKLLKKKDLPLVALEPWGDVISGNPASTNQATAKKPETTPDTGKGAGKPLTTIERILLGKRKVAPKADQPTVAITAMPEQGSGWQMSNQAVTPAAMAQAVAKVENLAKNLKTT